MVIATVVFQFLHLLMAMAMGLVTRMMPVPLFQALLQTMAAHRRRMPMATGCRMQPISV